MLPEVRAKTLKIIEKGLDLMSNDLIEGFVEPY